MGTETKGEAELNGGSHSVERLFAFDPERDWEGGYQEKCWSCGTLFWGRKDAPYCRPCSKKNEEWWDSLTEDQQLKHMRKLAEGLQSCKANNRIE